MKGKYKTNLVNVWLDTYQEATKIYRQQEAELYSTSFTIDLPEQIRSTPAIVEVKNIDTLLLAEEYGDNTLILNMASDYTPGGGVKKGSMAQEEEIFRRTSAFASHDKKYYPLKPDEVLYANAVTVLKDEKYDYIDPFVVSMISVPALRNPGKTYNEEQRTIMRNKIELIFKLAIYHQKTKLVLGALGCGAFNNPPYEVALIFKEMITKYQYYFERIGFAILSRGDQNYKIFREILA